MVAARNHPPPCFIRHKDGVKLSPTIECSTRHLLDPSARVKSSLSLKTHCPSEKERATGRNSRFHHLRMDINEAGVLLDSHPRRKNKALLLDITIVNPCGSSNLENAARRAGKHPRRRSQQKKNKYPGSFPATYPLLPLATSTRGEAGSDVHAFIKELAIRRVEHRSEIHSKESRHLVEGTEVARLCR